MSTPTPGRRSSSGGPALDTTTVLAVLLPLLTIAALLLVRPAADERPARPPELTPLSRVLLVCPGAADGAAGEVRLSSTGQGTRGTARLRSETGSGRSPVRPRRASVVDGGAGPLVVAAEDALAPHLVGARSAERPLAHAACRPSAPEVWFTGVGAGARHSSVLELVNPDAGPALADVTTYGGGGVLDVPQLRGVAVPGRSSVRLDLAAVVPRRGELALRVVTARGRIAASVLDRYDALGAGPTTAEWLPGQGEPSTANTLLGLPAGSGQRMLVLTNPGEDEARASLRVIDEESVFTPQGTREIRVPPGSVKRVKLTGELLAVLREGALGLQVDATSPVTATVRSLTGGDLSHAVAGPTVTESATVLVPEGDKRLLLAGADAVGVVTVTAWSASGKRLTRQRTELQPGRGADVSLPEGAVIVTVEVERSSVVASVLVAGRGVAVAPMVEQVRNGLVADVAPGLP